MNREILFRVWSKQHGMSEPCSIFDLQIMDAEGMTDMNDIEIMQYTGLCDKNGTKIFEGDVVLWGDKTARARGTAVHVVVEFRSGCFGILYEKRFHEFWQYIAEKWEEKEITDDMWGEMPIAEYFRACFEVVGNIHDNPELCDALFEAVKQVLGG